MTKRTSHPKHPDWSEVFIITPEALANALGDLKYDQLGTFLTHLARKIQSDAEKDSARGRTRLAQALRDAAHNLDKSADNAQQAWRICSRHMPPPADPGPKPNP